MCLTPADDALATWDRATTLSGLQRSDVRSAVSPVLGIPRWWRERWRIADPAVCMSVARFGERSPMGEQLISSPP